MKTLTNIESELKKKLLIKQCLNMFAECHVILFKTEENDYLTEKL